MVGNKSIRLLDTKVSYDKELKADQELPDEKRTPRKLTGLRLYCELYWFVKAPNLAIWPSAQLSIYSLLILTEA